MATRTVRLSEAEERILKRVQSATGLSVSEAIKEGLRLLEDRGQARDGSRALEIYRELDLGPGGYAIAPSTDIRGGMRKALAGKHDK